MQSNDDLVSVMVPRNYLSRVYGLIAELDGAKGTTQNSNSESSLSTDDQDAGPAVEWTPLRLRKMISQTHSSAMRDILRVLAENAGEWLTSHRLAASIEGKPDADWNTVAGTLGAFGRRVRNRYGLKTWPFEHRHNHSEKCGTYRMKAEIATLVLQYLNNGK